MLFADDPKFHVNPLTCLQQIKNEFICLEVHVRILVVETMWQKM